MSLIRSQSYFDLVDSFNLLGYDGVIFIFILGTKEGLSVKLFY